MKHPIRQTKIGAALVVYIAILTGCASTPERRPLPANLIDKVSIPGIPEARFWADEWPDYSENRINSISDDDLQKTSAATYNVPHNYLAISGGGSNGAFGAGLLAGWAAQGTRPEFTMVTGISTGALTAPFAFLGADYDAKLKAIYTTTRTEDVALTHNVVNNYAEIPYRILSP